MFIKNYKIINKYVFVTRARETTFEYKAQQPVWFVPIETIIIPMAYRGEGEIRVYHPTVF